MDIGWPSSDGIQALAGMAIVILVIGRIMDGNWRQSACIVLTGMAALWALFLTVNFGWSLYMQGGMSMLNYVLKGS